VRWIVTIEGSSRDVKRLVGAYPHLAAGQGVRQAVLDFDDGREEMSDQTREAIRQQIEATLRHINGCGKLRWGRSFPKASASRAA